MLSALLVDLLKVYPKELRARSSTRSTDPVTTSAVTIAETTAVIAEITVVAVIAETTATSAVSAERELPEKEAQSNHVNA